MGGIQAHMMGLNVWTGTKTYVQAMFATPENTVSGTTNVDYDSNSVAKLYADNYTDVKMKGTFFTNKNGNILPNGWTEEDNGGLLVATKDMPAIGIQTGDKAYALTKTTISSRGQYNRMYFGKAAFASKEQLSFTLAHELGHVKLNMLGYANSVLNGFGNVTEHHMAIGKMEQDLVKMNNWGKFNLPIQPAAAYFSEYGSQRYYESIKNLARKIKF
jgi:hypothetical protein